MVSTPPVPPDPDDLDEDPTGIRALLGSLPDPGPMPDDLVARIQASLTAEQAEGKFVILRSPTGALGRIAATSPLAKAAGVALVGAGDLTAGRTAVAAPVARPWSPSPPGAAGVGSSWAWPRPPWQRWPSASPRWRVGASAA